MCVVTILGVGPEILIIRSFSEHTHVHRDTYIHTNTHTHLTSTTTLGVQIYNFVGEMRTSRIRIHM